MARRSPCLRSRRWRLAADAVSQEAGLTVTFVGTLLVGLTTSLPELAATVSAVRIGALDLVAGNVFGSVAFNLLVFVFLDAAYRDGPLLQALSRRGRSRSQGTSVPYPRSGCPRSSGVFSGRCTMVASVSSSRLATDTAFSSAT